MRRYLKTANHQIMGAVKRAAVCAATAAREALLVNWPVAAALVAMVASALFVSPVLFLLFRHLC